jgi:hypothetical protein
MSTWSVENIEGTIPKVLRTFEAASPQHDNAPIAVVYGDRPDGGLAMIVVVLGGVAKEEMPDMIGAAVASANGKYALLVCDSIVVQRDVEQPTPERMFMAVLEGKGVHKAYMWDGKAESRIGTLPGENFEGRFYNFSGLLGQN